MVAFMLLKIFLVAEKAESFHNYVIRFSANIDMIFRLLTL